MSGTADPTHVYWDLENRKGLWARGEAMNSIDSKIPRRTQCGDHVHDCPQLAEEMDSLREENARLREAEAEAMALVLNHEGAIERLTRERDEARVKADVAIKEHDRMAAMLRADEAEVERLRAALRGISWMAGSGPSAAAQVLPNIKQRADEALAPEVKP